MGIQISAIIVEEGVLREVLERLIKFEKKYLLER